MAHYKWQSGLNSSGAIWAGVVSGDTSEHSTDVLTGSTTCVFGYSDSNFYAGNPHLGRGAPNTSEVDLTVTTSWTVTFDSRNNMTVETHTVIDSIVRTNKVGYPSCGKHLCRAMKACHHEGGAAIWTGEDCDIDSMHTIATNVDIGTYTITIAPGGEFGSQYSMFFNNKTKNSSTPSSGDQLYMGVKFTNDMPADYRPGAIKQGNIYLSHNRDAGEAHVLHGTWREMRTLNGHVDNDNPPSIRKNNIWTDQLLIGKE